MNRKILLTFCFSLILILQGCFFSTRVSINGKGNIRLEQVEFSEISKWNEDNHKEALKAFLHSCNKFSKMAQRRLIGGQIGDIQVGDFRDVCDIAQLVKTMSNKQTQNFFENWFRPFLVKTRMGNSKGVFTGYYEASLNGSKYQTSKYKYPLYKKPKDLTKEPYLSREEIENGGLNKKKLELLYVDDKVDLFFMHIQGSGRVKLPNGSQLRIAYGGRNNQPYTSIGNIMSDDGLIPRNKISAASVKEWLKNNPDKADKYMNINAAYTFFRRGDGEYVVGAQNVPLTPERSLAVDKNVIPYGMPLYIDTKLKKPDGSKEKYSRLFIAQDTGSAIKGTVRGDIFFGHGKEAEEKAFYMASQGKYYILLPINIVDKLR